MSRVFKCDNCEKEGTTSRLVVPEGWLQVTVSSYVPRPIGGYGGQVSIKKDLCDDCVGKAFPRDLEPQPTISEQFADVARDFMAELAQEAIDNLEP